MRNFLLILLIIPLLSHKHIEEKESVVFKIAENSQLGSREKIATEAIDLLNKAFNSDSFKAKIRNHEYLNKKSFKKNTYKISKNNYSKKLSNEEVLEKLMKDKTVTIKLVINTNKKTNRKKKRNVVIGSSAFKSYRITTYSWWFREGNYESPKDYAKHIAHEYCHILGFSHAKKPNSSRSKTVPYAVGNLLEEVLDEMDKSS